MESHPSPPSRLHPQQAPPSSRSTLSSRLLKLLDSLLSDSLRRAPAWDLVRYRILVGATCFLLLYNTLYLVWALLLGMSPYPVLGAVSLYLGILWVTRRATSSFIPALLLLLSMCLVLMASTFTGQTPEASIHAVTMLLPALAVYLGGSRLGLLIALFMIVTLSVSYPLYLSLNGARFEPFSPSVLWFAHFFAGISFLGAWGLGALHNAARDSAQASLEEMHRTLVDVSRQAGMAEVATGVLHNVGNTLNSVNISTSLVTDQLRLSRVTKLAKAATLLREHASDLSSFLTQDPQGRKLPAYLIALSDQLQVERDAMLQEMLALTESVDHIKSIISMQQRHARTAGAMEQVMVPQLIDEALRLHAVSFEQLGIRIERTYAQVPPLVVDRHKLLQILTNLLRNARHALEVVQRPDKCLSIRVQGAAETGELLIAVADNGVGIAPENLPRLFTQGFTTKKTGHGFGLHISALAAQEMRGRLTCSSAGPGQGATFTLVLPIAGESTPE